MQASPRPPGDCLATTSDLNDAQRTLDAARQRVHILRQREESNAREHNARRLHSVLPPELLLQVARYVVADHPRAAPKLAAICTAFRDHIYASPDLWQRIVITQNDPDPADIARAYVSRSGRRPLDITLRLFADPSTRGTDDAEREVGTLFERLSEARDFLGRARSHPAPDEWPPVLEAALKEMQAYKTRAIAAANWDTSLARAMRTLFAEFDRCFRFEFCSARRRPTELVADHIQAASAPILRELTLHLDPNCRLPPIAPRHAPLLSRADVQGVLAEPVAQFRGLHHLRIVNGTFNAPSTPLAPLLGLLRANPELEDLCLQPLIPYPVPLPSASPTRLVLPRLKRLHLIHNARLEPLMNSLRLPALAELTLAVQAGCNSPDLKQIFRAAPFPQLRTLRLVNLFINDTTNDLAATLQQLATLRSLSISESNLCESVLRTLADPLCCPLLEELVFERCDGISHDAILEIWRARGGKINLETRASVDMRRSRSTNIQLNGGRGTLRSLAVRNSSAPLADMQLGEREREPLRQRL